VPHRTSIHLVAFFVCVCCVQLSELDDDTSNDEITADMFVAFCRQNGFVPPPLSSDSLFEPSSSLRLAK
jgi:hypothetical protein